MIEAARTLLFAPGEDERTPEMIDRSVALRAQRSLRDAERSS